MYLMQDNESEDTSIVEKAMNIFNINSQNKFDRLSTVIEVTSAYSNIPMRTTTAGATNNARKNSLREFFKINNELNILRES